VYGPKNFEILEVLCERANTDARTGDNDIYRARAHEIGGRRMKRRAVTDIQHINAVICARKLGRQPFQGITAAPHQTQLSTAPRKAKSERGTYAAARSCDEDPFQARIRQLPDRLSALAPSRPAGLFRCGCTACPLPLHVHRRW